ncbi:MAG TPA: SusC/RagA family TonB-linked outer membrane protein [Gemmatimonadaceae bacterium]|nr:SusC/RagA family TonB-linked outer membrane protein [Gemmatimonadaceae bacterium]
MAAQVTRLARWITRAMALAVLLAPAASAQSGGTIRGRVVDASARPLQDVNVTVTGTRLGGMTNANGEFIITGVPAGTQQVGARRIGFARQVKNVTVTAGGEVTAEFQLSPAATTLDEVVVTGTAGSMERRQIGNAITTLNVEEMNSKASLSNVTEILQGKTPGVVVLPGSGVPGTGADIRIRGTSSTSGYRPVVYIDGVRYNIDDVGNFAPTGGGTLLLTASSQVTSALNHLNPNDIESIEVIKGPAAATLYGAEAANGVIQIITKKGTRGAQNLRWGFRTEQANTEWFLFPNDNLTTCDAAKQAATVSATDLRPLWPGCQGLPVNTVISDNPIQRDSRALRDGNLEKYSLNATGGGDRYSFYIAGDREYETGVFYNSNNSRTSVRTNFGVNPNDKTDFRLSFNYSDGRLRLPIQDESANGLLLSSVRGLAGRFNTVEENQGWGVQAPPAANRYKNFSNSERMTLSGTVNWSPFTWFQNRFTGGFDNTTTQAQLLFLPGDIEPGQDPDAASGANLRRTPMRRILTLDYGSNLTYNPTLSWATDFMTTTSFGAQVIADRTETVGATGIGIGAPDVTRVDLLQRTLGNEGFTENNSVGYYVQEHIGWRDRLFVTAAIRADDHSSFGSDFDIITYPKLSASYVLSDEPAAQPFLNSARISSLQLRAAWGQAGRAPSAYSGPQTYTISTVQLGAGLGSALRPLAFGNPVLKPERGEEIELGFEAGMFQNRLSADFTYYNKRTTDMLQSIPVGGSSGFLGSYLSNLGEVTNSGFEISLSGMAIDRDRVRWEPRLNIATNKNELVSFGVPGKTLESAGTQPYGVVQQHREGYPLGGFWVAPHLRCGIDALAATAAPTTCDNVETGVAQLTAAGAAIVNAGDTARRYLGSPSPSRTIGFANTVTLFRNVRLYALLDHMGGFKVFNQQERGRCQSQDNCSRTNNPIARFPQGNTAADTVAWRASREFRELAVYRSTSPSTEWIQDGDFVKLREVSLTLDLPQQYARRVRASNASLTFAGRNLAVWSDYEGADPEVNSYSNRSFVRIDAYAAPMMRRYSAMLTLQF